MFPRYTVLHRNESLDTFVMMVVICNVSPLETFLELHSLKILLRILLSTSIINIFQINKNVPWFLNKSYIYVYTTSHIAKPQT